MDDLPVHIIDNICGELSLRTLVCIIKKYDSHQALREIYRRLPPEGVKSAQSLFNRGCLEGNWDWLEYAETLGYCNYDEGMIQACVGNQSDIGSELCVRGIHHVGDAILTLCEYGHQEMFDEIVSYELFHLDMDSKRVKRILNDALYELYKRDNHEFVRHICETYEFKISRKLIQFLNKSLRWNSTNAKTIRYIQDKYIAQMIQPRVIIEPFFARSIDSSPTYTGGSN